MVATREKFSSQADPDLLEGMREIARREGRHFQAVLEDAMSAYIEGKNQERVRPAVMGVNGAAMMDHRGGDKLYHLAPIVQHKCQC